MLAGMPQRQDSYAIGTDRCGARTDVRAQGLVMVDRKITGRLANPVWIAHDQSGSHPVGMVQAIAQLRGLGPMERVVLTRADMVTGCFESTGGSKIPSAQKQARDGLHLRTDMTMMQYGVGQPANPVPAAAYDAAIATDRVQIVYAPKDERLGSIQTEFGPPVRLGDAVGLGPPAVVPW